MVARNNNNLFFVETVRESINPPGGLMVMEKRHLTRDSQSFIQSPCLSFVTDEKSVVITTREGDEWLVKVKTVLFVWESFHLDYNPILY
mgnify:CR=1 FL=1